MAYTAALLLLGAVTGTAWIVRADTASGGPVLPRTPRTAAIFLRRRRSWTVPPQLLIQAGLRGGELAHALLGVQKLGQDTVDAGL